MSFSTSAVPSSVQESLKLQFLTEKDISVQVILKKKNKGLWLFKAAKEKEKRNGSIQSCGH